ncbi:MAG TPA: fumarylacetoacetate hydrolase family protein [Pseudonocardia sp.]|nr:fumarylacetoacetate hydrolase family protein [Pseudonocardia sp.]
MAYASYEYEGRGRVGRVSGDRLVPLAGLTELGRDTPTEVLASAANSAEPSVALADVRLLPVVPNPDKILCVGLNYHSHVGETGRELPTYPVLFAKFASSLIGASDDIVLPPESTQVDYEAELAVVIGRTGRRIPRASALEHVLGYTVANDVTMRDYQYKTHQWIQGKAWDRSTPLGPYLVPPGEVDLTGAGIRTVLRSPETRSSQARQGSDVARGSEVSRGSDVARGSEVSQGSEVLQSSDLSKLIFDIPKLIATVSEFCTLLPGDVILTGTPGGVGYRRSPQVFLAEGDQITVEIDGVGRLTNRVRAEHPVAPLAPVPSAAVPATVQS